MISSPIQRFIRYRLKYPREITFVEELPTTVAGKIQLTVLADRGRE